MGSGVCKAPSFMGLAMSSLLTQAPDLAPGWSCDSILPDMRLLCWDQGPLLPETSHVEEWVTLDQGCLGPERWTTESSLSGKPLLWSRWSPHSSPRNLDLIPTQTRISLYWSVTILLWLRLRPCWELWGVEEGMPTLISLPGHSRPESRFGRSLNDPLSFGVVLSPVFIHGGPISQIKEFLGNSTSTQTEAVSLMQTLQVPVPDLMWDRKTATYDRGPKRKVGCQRKMMLIYPFFFQ